MAHWIPNVLVIVKQENRNAHWRRVWARKHHPYKRQTDCGQMRLRYNASTLVFVVRDPYRISASACAMAPCVMVLPGKPNNAPECFWHKFSLLFQLQKGTYPCGVFMVKGYEKTFAVCFFLIRKNHILMPSSELLLCQCYFKYFSLLYVDYRELKLYNPDNF